MRHSQSAPWFDWGPYLWTNGELGRSDGLIWCGGQSGVGHPCHGSCDVRYGDLSDETGLWGDFTHPSASGQQKVATQLVEWIQGELPSAQSFISDWVTPWIGK